MKEFGAKNILLQNVCYENFDIFSNTCISFTIQIKNTLWYFLCILYYQMLQIAN